MGVRTETVVAKVLQHEVEVTLQASDTDNTSAANAGARRGLGGAPANPRCV
jgi:hypothetical protein